MCVDAHCARRARREKEGAPVFCPTDERELYYYYYTSALLCRSLDTPKQKRGGLGWGGSRCWLWPKTSEGIRLDIHID